jgi:hypothetical protein
VKMENHPFMSPQDDQPSRSAPLRESDPRREVWTPADDMERRFHPMMEDTPKKNPFDAFRENQMALVLLGIVIGVIIMNMRPIIVNPVK